MRKNTVTYYITKNGKNPVLDFLDSLMERQKSKAFRIFEYIQLYGLISVLPHVKKIVGTALWEIRILGQDNIRILYIAVTKEEILLLHGFLKKTQKTSTREIRIALERLEEWKTRNTKKK